MSSLKICLYILLLLLNSSHSQTNTSTNKETVKDEKLNILFIGNSLTYTNKMPDMLIKLLKQTDIKVGLVEVVAFANYGLPDHWNTPVSRHKITTQPWDYVILQQGPSATEGRPYLLDYSKGFARIIRDAGAEPALFMVWPTKDRFSDFDGVSDSYQTAAKEMDGSLFPVGEAWRKAWLKQDKLQLYGKDGFHPSRMGSYLAALVFFDQLVNPEPQAQPAIITKVADTFRISKDLAALLFNAAREANEEFARKQ